MAGRPAGLCSELPTCAYLAFCSVSFSEHRNAPPITPCLVPCPRRPHRPHAPSSVHCPPRPHTPALTPFVAAHPDRPRAPHPDSLP